MHVVHFRVPLRAVACAVSCGACHRDAVQEALELMLTGDAEQSDAKRIKLKHEPVPPAAPVAHKPAGSGGDVIDLT
jgi:hypothetical protein